MQIWVFHYFWSSSNWLKYKSNPRTPHYPITHYLTLLPCIHEVLDFIPPSTMPKTSLEIHAHVIALHIKQWSCHTTTMKLGTTPSTIGHIIKRYETTWKLEDKGRSRHPYDLSSHD